VAAASHGRAAEREYIDAQGLAWQALEEVRSAREDYAAVLAELGFVPRAYVDAVRGRDSAETRAARAHADAHAGSLRVVKAALAAGLYPNVLRVAHPESKYAPTAGGTIAVEAAAAAVRFFAREAGRVFLHPSSALFGCGAFDSPWLVYSDASEHAASRRVYVRAATMVPAYALLLFGGDVSVRHERGTLALDGWAEFEAPARIAVLVRELRAGVDRLLAAKVADPGLDVAASPVVLALLNLVRSDGF
jgi:ATP-dependent RNA helicase DHX57